MTKILVTGVGGQLGHYLVTSLREKFADVLPCSSSPRPGCQSLDLADFDQIKAVIRAVKPDYLINAGAYTAVDQAETEQDQAMAVNGYAMGVMAEELKAIGSTLIHFSTDYVFDGSGERPWLESDPTAPINAYGRSKLLGEQEIEKVGGNYYILRTSWVYSPRGKNFFNTMIRLAGERDKLRIVADQWGTPTSAIYLANQTVKLVERLIANPSLKADSSGVYHLSHEGYTNWAGFAEAIFKEARDHGLIQSVPEVEPISSEQFPTPARRPLNSRLDCSAFARCFDIPLSSWQTGLVEACQ